MEINCSSDFVSRLPACDWASPCASAGSCFQGEYGTWGNVLSCEAGGYYANPDVCIGWSDSLPSLSSSSSGSLSETGFDWQNVRQGYKDFYDVFLTIFMAYLVVKLVNMAK